MLGFPFELDEFQKDACKCIENRESVVVCAPTGAGKTVIAEYAIQLALENGERIFYTTPLKALSNQKFYDFSRKYGAEKVGLLTGDTSINRNGQIVVMTTEVFRNMLYCTNFGSITDNMQSVKYVVLDEVHYMNDEQRGTVWEESIIYCPTDVQIIALSATVANAKQLTEWINTVHSKTTLIDTDFRPVPLRYYYFDSSQPDKLLPLIAPNGGLNKKIRPEKRDFRRGPRGKSQQKSHVKDVIRNLYNNDMLPAIYFTFSRRKCDEQMEKCVSLELVTQEEQNKIKEVIDEFLAENPYLYNNKHIEFLMQGVASHHAGLLPGWKLLVEKLFQQGLIKVVFATETLAAGINMPARSTVISSISKRTDSGHRTLTPSEFLQMSGRAGRRGMDEVGYVTIVGTPYQSPQEVADLVLSDANPLESRFAPSYSMVLNLLQRFTIDEAKELILKSFGYFSSNTRLAGLQLLIDENNRKLKEAAKFVCPYKYTTDDLREFNKVRDNYVQNRRIMKTIYKQEKNKKRPLPQEAAEFEKFVKTLLNKMHSFKCGQCNRYKKHMKEIELLERFEKRGNMLQKEMDNQKDIFWNKFISHRNVLAEYEYLKGDYPTEKGKTASQIRSENELFLSEIIFSKVLENLTPAELASVICAVTTEDLRVECGLGLPLSPNVRKTLNKIKDIRRKLEKVQKDNDIEDVMYINSYFSPLIELWISGSEWEEIMNYAGDMGEGDIVRCFKRVVDVLRQFTTIENISEALVYTSRDAINSILREPIDVD